jgi:hypothetical protein
LVSNICCFLVSLSFTLYFLKIKQDANWYALQRRIFTSLERISTLIETTPKATLEKHSSYLEGVLRNAIDGKLNTLLSEPVRKGIANIFISMYTHMDTRSTYETLTSLIAKTSSKQLNNVRLAAYTCISKIFSYFGAKFARLFPDILAAMVRGIKSSIVAERVEVSANLVETLFNIDAVIIIPQGKEIISLIPKMLADKHLDVRVSGYSMLVSQHYYNMSYVHIYIYIYIYIYILYLCI